MNIPPQRKRAALLMIDFHTHVLPGLDDGCRDIFESQSVLSMLAAQEVTTVIATPHFNARGDTPESFFEARARAYGEITTATSNLPVPDILLGAEIGYFYGVSRMRELADMRIEGTRLLLLEMPMAPWSESTVRELCVCRPELCGGSSSVSERRSKRSSLKPISKN